jgi:hypothetical protein
MLLIWVACTILSIYFIVLSLCASSCTEVLQYYRSSRKMVVFIIGEREGELCSSDEMRMCKGQKYRWDCFQQVSRESRRNDGTIARTKERSCRSTEEVASPLIMFSLVLSACNHEMYPSLAP